ncbi:MAG: ATP-dependent 6-phosphofructokinase, partial [Clostridia bacterium]|nr:ATP-dependent 6-phosphofructokinase [Clostridia bacterium]
IAYELAAKGANVIGIPKSIDNDIQATDQTFGFDTAVTTATEALDKLHTTAESHHRVMVLELMGRYTGWIALYSGLAGGADVILIPELPWKPEGVADKVIRRRTEGKPFSIVVVAEGTPTPEGKLITREIIPESRETLRLGGIGNVVGRIIEEKTGIETRVTVLGHIQRGGSPTPFDRVLATRFGVAAAELALARTYGVLVCLQGGKITPTSLTREAVKTRPVPPDSQLLQVARELNIYIGESETSKRQ